MDRTYRILAINTGSTSTKIATFENERKTHQEDIDHTLEELSRYPTVPEQQPFRRAVVADTLAAAGRSVEDFDVFVGRGGGLNPCEGGTYEVGGLLLEHARCCASGPHPAAIGTAIAYEFAQKAGGKAYTVDPPDADDFEPIARIGGIKSLPRESRAHVLNQKEAGRRAAADLGRPYEDLRLVVAHIGGGISVGAHKGGKIVDATNLIDGEGPMAPTRSGTLPVGRVVKLMESGVPGDRIRQYILKDGGVLDHLGTSDMREVERMIEGGDEYARLVRDALVYSIAKSIGALATAFGGSVDGIVLTGGLARSKAITEGIKGRVGFVAPVLVYPGEFEMEALAGGVLRVLRGEEAVKEYRG